VLGQQGHRLLEARDGSEGLARARAEQPDLVIADVLMPVMDGYEFVRQLRNDPATSAIPVLFNTAHYDGPDAQALALASGVSGVLAKPSNSIDVLTLVSRLLSEAPASAPPADPPLPTEFDRAHLRLLTDTLAAKESSLAIANARLLSLFHAGLEFACTRDPDLLLQGVCETSCELFGATYVTLGVLSPDGRIVRRIFGAGEAGKCGATAANWIQPGDDVPGVLRAVVAERRTVRGANPGGEPLGLQLPSGHPAVENFLAVPIASLNHVFGWVFLAGNGGKTFTDADEHLLTALAERLGRIYEIPVPGTEIHGSN
jgi:CheY-like chemotaxis protein